MVVSGCISSTSDLAANPGFYLDTNRANVALSRWAGA